MDQITYALAGMVAGMITVMATQALAEHRRFVSAKHLVKEQLWWFDFIATWGEIALRHNGQR